MVNMTLVHQFINEENEFVADEKLEKAAHLMLAQLVRWTKGLKVVNEI